MRSIIATFPSRMDAVTYARSLREAFGVLGHVVSVGRIGVSKESYEEHRLVIAWVSGDRAGAIHELAERCGGHAHGPRRPVAGLR